MQEIEALVGFYHTAFTICIVLFLVFLLITVLLFWKFKIITIVQVRSGRALRKTIQQMEKINAQTAQLEQRRSDYWIETMHLNQGNNIQIGRFIVERNVVIMHTEEII